MVFGKSWEPTRRPRLVRASAFRSWPEPIAGSTMNALQWQGTPEGGHASGYSGHLGFLPRQRSMPAERRQNRRRRAGVALPAQEARRRRPEPRDTLLSSRGRHRPPRPAIYRLLRRASREVRAPARDVSVLRTAGAHVVHSRDAGLVEGKAVPEEPASTRACRAGRRFETVGGPPDTLRRAPRISCRIGLLSLSVRHGGGPVHGRRGGVGNDLGVAGPRE